MSLVGMVLAAFVETAAWAGPPAALPAVPPGWGLCDAPLLGMRVAVPPGFEVHLYMDSILAVVRSRGVAVAQAWLLPFNQTLGATAPQLAEAADHVFTELVAGYRGQPSGQPAPDRALWPYVAVQNDQPCEGRFLAITAAQVPVGAILGAAAAQGRLEAERPVLETIAKSVSLYRPRGRWGPYRSPNGALRLTIPRGWTVQTGPPNPTRVEIDWTASDPSNPSAFAFSFTPRFGSADIAADAHALTSRTSGRADPPYGGRAGSGESARCELRRPSPCTPSLKGRAARPPQGEPGEFPGVGSAEPAEEVSFCRMSHF